MNIIEVEGIGPVYAGKLEAAGVKTTEELLSRGATRHGREELEEATGIGHPLILTWVNHVDLMRLDGVGPEYSELLEAAGVDSPAELAHRNAANLAQTLAEANAARKLVRHVPGEEAVAGWISQAAALGKTVEH